MTYTFILLLYYLKSKFFKTNIVFKINISWKWLFRVLITSQFIYAISVICFKSLYIMTLRYLNQKNIIESITLLCHSIKNTKEEKYKLHRHIGFSFLFILSLDKMTSFYILKELQRSINRKLSEYEFCCF